jgi:hypothetical protein
VLAAIARGGGIELGLVKDTINLDVEQGKKLRSPSDYPTAKFDPAAQGLPRSWGVWPNEAVGNTTAATVATVRRNLLINSELKGRSAR